MPPQPNLHVKRQLWAIELLYLAAEKRSGSDCLDRSLTAADVAALEPLLEGNLFIELGNRGRIEGYSSNQNWTFILTFVQQVLQRGALTKAGDELHRISAKLDRLEKLYGQINSESQLSKCQTSERCLLLSWRTSTS